MMGIPGARLKEIFISALRARFERSRASATTAFSLLATELVRPRGTVLQSARTPRFYRLARIADEVGNFVEKSPAFTEKQIVVMSASDGDHVRVRQRRRKLHPHRIRYHSIVGPV